MKIENIIFESIKLLQILNSAVFKILIKNYDTRVLTSQCFVLLEALRVSKDTWKLLSPGNSSIQGDVEVGPI